MKKQIKKQVKKSLPKIIGIIIISVIIFCAVSIIEQRTTFADSGHSTSHHSRSSSSSSKSSSSKSRSYSSSSSRRSSSSKSRNSSSSGSSGVKMSKKAALILLICIVGIPVSLIIIESKISSRSRKKYISPITKKETISENINNKIKSKIPDFDAKEFISDAFNIYKDIQVAWMNFDLESVRNLITDEMFNMYQSQLAVMEASNEQNIMKDMIMQDGYIVDAVDQNGVLTIVTQYIIDQYDYVANRTTGKLIRGESKYKMRVEYLMKFRLNIDASQIIDHCPNCGAKIEKINGSGVCEYCGSKIVSENKNWVLTEKQVINQDYI